MVHRIIKKAIGITDYLLAWGFLLAGTVLVGIALLGIIVPLMVAFPLLALAAAFFARQADDRSVLVPATA